MRSLALCIALVVCACSNAQTGIPEGSVQPQGQTLGDILSNTASDSFYCAVGDVAVYRHGPDSLVSIHEKIHGRLLFLTSKGVTYVRSEDAPRELTGSTPERWATTGGIDQPLVEVLPENPHECLTWAGVETPGSVKSDGLTALKTPDGGDLVTVVSARGAVTSVEVQNSKDEIYLRLLVGPLADKHHSPVFTKEKLSLAGARAVSASEYLELSEAER